MEILGFMQGVNLIIVLSVVIFVLDLQMVNIGLRVLARPQASMLPEMYRKLGLDFDERVLPSIMNEVHCMLVVILAIGSEGLKLMQTVGVFTGHPADFFAANYKDAILLLFILP